MNEPIRIPPLLIGKTLSDLIAEHNYRVEQIWMLKGSACKPFTPSSPSTVPAVADPSRVVTVEHGGALQKAS